jgi:hypothetical protein
MFSSGVHGFTFVSWFAECIQGTQALLSAMAMAVNSLGFQSASVTNQVSVGWKLVMFN